MKVEGMKVEVDIDIDENALRRVVYGMPETMEMIEDATSDVCDRANAMAAGYRTGIWHDPKTRERRGDTPAKYDKKAEPRRQSGPCAVPTGIVFNGNYAALKENNEHNTLLKAMG